jgi:hypothetical protein
MPPLVPLQSQLPFSSGFALAQHRYDAAWLIYPEMATESPRIEIWKKAESPTGVVWRLTMPDGSTLAELDEPKPKPGYSYSQGDCRIDGNPRSDIVAMVKHSKAKEWSRQVERVWVADPKRKQFIPRVARGVECRNESYGV